jgi:hypothetical protein
VLEGFPRAVTSADVKEFLGDINGAMLQNIREATQAVVSPVGG